MGHRGKNEGNMWERWGLEHYSQAEHSHRSSLLYLKYNKQKYHELKLKVFNISPYRILNRCYICYKNVQTVHNCVAGGESFNSFLPLKIYLRRVYLKMYPIIYEK